MGTRRRATAVPYLVIGVLALILLVPGNGAAQVLYGSVVGDVVDSTGAALPGANIVLTNNGTGLSREAAPTVRATTTCRAFRPACTR